MKDVIIFYIIVGVCLGINLLFLLKDGSKYYELFFYYLIVLCIILGLGIYLSKKYHKELEIIDKYHFEWNQQLEIDTPKCGDQANNCQNTITWDDGIIPYDLSEIGDTTISRKKYLNMKLMSSYILLGLLLVIIIMVLIYLIQNIYYHYRRKKQKKKTFKK